MIRKLIIIFSSLIFVLALNSEEIFIKDFGYYVDTPEKWEKINSNEPSITSFTDPVHVSVFQIYTFDGQQYKTAKDLFDYIKKSLKAEGDQSGFKYNNMDSIFADLTFNTGAYEVRGYYIFIKGSQYAFALMSYAPVTYYKEYHDLLLSCLNSFSINKEAKLKSGPVSQFYYPGTKHEYTKAILEINKKSMNTTIDKSEIEAEQVVIEREARILSNYKDDYINAWKRFYRMIYKDEYSRMDSIYNLIKPIFNSNTPLDVATGLLAWMQDFKYTRSETLADFNPPLDIILNKNGDCDSRALLYVILLQHFNIDAIILISSVYSHAGAGVNINADGAKITFDNKNYIFAELTANVKLGLIAKHQADPAGWIPVKLGDF